jgi:hypothetical protein
MTSRPLIEMQLPALRRHFDDNLDAAEALRLLAAELGLRKSLKAKRLHKDVDTRLKELEPEDRVLAGGKDNLANPSQRGIESGQNPHMDNQKFINSLEEKFPLLSELRFFREDFKKPEPLPSLIALTAAMTDPDLSGDACVVLPCRERIAAFTAVLAALSAARDHFPILHKKYIERGFEVGERVRVLPTGHVFEFGGFITHDYSQFFKLRFLNDASGAARSFPIKDAVLLEKTTRRAPRGTGRSKLGSYMPSPIDDVLNIQTGGNNALLANEIMLVSTQREFLEFMDTVYISRTDKPESVFLLHDVIPWGVVNSEGKIEFRESSAASGAPLIAVSARTEFVAEACRRTGGTSPRVIIDGAIRIKDLQSFDDIVDHSKLLVVADHTRLDEFSKLEERECAVWKLPDGLENFEGSKYGLLRRFTQAYKTASNFRLHIEKCSSDPCDDIEARLRKAEQRLRECEADQEDLKALSIAYSRLIDLAAVVHIPTDDSMKEFRASLQSGRSTLTARRMFIDTEANEHLAACFDIMEAGLEPGSSTYRLDKQKKLLQLVKDLQPRCNNLIVLAPSIFAAESARVFLNDQSNCDVCISTIQAIRNDDSFDNIVLTGWPRARHFKKLLDRYTAPNIYALAYSFEHKWFTQTRHKRARQLCRWESKLDAVNKLTGIDRPLVFKTVDLPPAPSHVETGIFKTETLLDRIKKGTPYQGDNERDSRDGKYVSFAGSCYGYMTKTHKIPKVTSLVSGTLGSGERIPLVVLDDLRIGDFVLFRANDGSQKDLIRQIAEHAEGLENYLEIREKSEEWKSALFSLGNTQQEIIDSLHASGMTRTNQAIRGWLNDPARIGPADYEDLVTIAASAVDGSVASEIEEIWAAIRQVRGIHMAAGMELSKLLVEHLPGQLPEISDEETIVDLNLGGMSLGRVLIVQIDNIGDNYEKRAYWEVNQVLVEDLIGNSKWQQ